MDILGKLGVAVICKGLTLPLPFDTLLIGLVCSILDHVDSVFAPDTVDVTHVKQCSAGLGLGKKSLFTILAFSR